MRLPPCRRDTGRGDLLLRGGGDDSSGDVFIPRVRGVPSDLPLGRLPRPLFGCLIRPFCIMLLYRYIFHYGLLLHIMSQYLCLFSLILQGLHEEGECRQLEFWARKGANIRDLFYTTPKVLKLHGSQFQNI